MHYLCVVIFFPFTNLVEVDDCRIFMPPPEMCLLCVLLNMCTSVCQKWNTYTKSQEQFMVPPFMKPPVELLNV